MKICIIRHAYFPADPRVRKQVSALLEAGHSVDIICLRPKRRVAIKDIQGVRILRIPICHKRGGTLRYCLEYGFSFLVMGALLSYLHWRNPYHCIQVSTMPDFLVFTTLLPKLLGAKVLLDLHEPTPELYVTKYGSNRLSLLLWLQVQLEQLAIKYADRSLTVTETLRRRFGQRGADIETITVVPNVCEEAFEQSFCDSLKEDLATSNGTFRLVTHGHIEERYGHELVIKAVTSLKSNIPEIHYDIIGDGQYKQKLVEMVHELGCEDRIHFLGFLPLDDLLHELLKADVGVIGMQRSPYSELIDTNKMYEYIAYRKPVIVPRLRALEENFDDSCVMFFEPGNHQDLARCIMDLYQNPEKRQYLAENAYRRYEPMCWKKSKKIYLQVVNNLTGKRAG